MSESPDEYCTRELRSADPDRWLTALFAPDARRPGLHALYAFNAEIARAREAVSQPMIGQIRLQWWREAWEGIWENRPRNHPVVRALHAHCQRLDRGNVFALIDARETDMEEKPPADMNALLEYAEASSAPLMQLAAQQLGAALPPDIARDAGIAYALIGLLRATPHLATQHRVMLPANVLGAHGLMPEDVYQRENHASLAAAMSEIAEEAGRRLRAARSGHVTREALPALLPTTLAGLHLSALTRLHFDVTAAENVVTPLRRQMALLWASLRGRF
ncbi:MAG: phytoene/squalene synthase family protein [Ferrovibrio sp.]|uniref:phytoene/squalene synthase family protein n=1 Tax=Ferrovibrio sp. TaxID=1917215 RepID=UPI0039194AD0